MGKVRHSIAMAAGCTACLQLWEADDALSMHKTAVARGMGQTEEHMNRS